MGSNARIEPFNFDRDLDGYRAFAKLQFGEMSFQAQERFLCWLYAENMLNSKGYQSLLIGRTREGEIVGCIHKMRLNWIVDGKETSVPATHNLMVSESHRTGLGIMLQMASWQNERFVLIPGVVGPLSHALAKLRCLELDGQWYRRILSPVRGALRLAAHVLLKRPATPRYFPISDTVLSALARKRKLSFSLAPNDRLLEAIASSLNASYGSATAHPVWRLNDARWRFFHPLAPRHILIHAENSTSVLDFLIVSLGPRRGLNVGRIIAGNATSDDAAHRLAGFASSVVRTAGDVMLAFSANAGFNHSLRSCGWSTMRTHPRTFLHAKDPIVLESISFSGEAGDFGFEAMPID